MAPADPRSRRGERLRTVLQILSEHPDGLQAKTVLAQAADRLTLNNYELGTSDKGGRRRFEYVTRFGTVNAVKAGWLTKDKGTWTLTDEGSTALADHTNPEALYEAAEAGYSAWAKKQPNKTKPAAAVTPDPAAAVETVSSVTVEEAEETSFEEIRQHLATMNPYDLQKLVAGLLRGMGYHVSWVSPPGKDRGVDIVAFRDPLGTEDPRIKVQVKREQDKTTAKSLRAFMSVLNPGDVGVYVTLGGFTSDAESEARNSETRRVTLIDLSDLFDLWVEHYERIPAADRQYLPLKPVWFLASSASEEDEE